jgi:para-nitrobenzyl esterase
LTATSKRPVIIFLYGGGGTIGSSGSDLYNGEAVARHGAVFVDPNYRVGVLGFMAHLALTAEQGRHSGNYGYLDQNSAIRWLHDNIAQFGGDHDHVVITGQSAGAGSVVQQTFSPLSTGLLQGVVMSPGCTWRGATGTTLSEAEQTGLEVQHLLGAADLEAMRAAPADKILATQCESQLGVHHQACEPGAWWTAISCRTLKP